MSYDTLFATPSFINGAARVLDLGSTLNEYNFSKSEKEADSESLMLDWEAVGFDLYEAIDGYKQKQKRK